MAGDWIKMRIALRRHPKVVRIASALKADKLRVVGALHAIWGVFDEHSINGHLPGYTFETMDDEIGWPGFSRAMNGIGWLDHDGDCGLVMPSFDTHNGASAKRRAQESDRKRAERTSPQSVLPLSASDADEMRTREEKRREDTPSLRSGGRATRLPKDWTLPTPWLTWAMVDQPTWNEAHGKREGDKFRDYWVAKSGKDATKEDWEATWRNWVRKAGPMQGPKGAASDEWTRTDAEIARKGAELGIPRKDGETASSHRDRINVKLYGARA